MARKHLLKGLIEEKRTDPLPAPDNSEPPSGPATQTTAPGVPRPASAT